VSEVERAVTVTAPAAADSIAILRTVAANVAARTEAPIDIVDDLRLAVGEACNRLLVAAPDTASLRMEIVASSGTVVARLTTTYVEDPVPEEDPLSELSWAIIRGLTERAESSTVDGHQTITMSVRTSPTGR
jgi:serine/threonine-protein kinase RsbW